MLSFFQNKRIAVTGGNGFLGRNVVSQLGEAGAPPSNIYVPGYDLRETRNVGRLYFEFRPDIVIHLAASVGGLQANIKNPGSFFYDNVKMGIELLETGRRYGLQKFIQMGTACEYPGLVTVPTIERDLWNGYPETTNASYGIAKRALLTMGQAYRKQYGMSVIHLLSTNLYGPDDNFDPASSHVIPALIKRFTEARDKNVAFVETWGDGCASRDFLYVTEAARAILLATEKFDESYPVNLGSGCETLIEELATIIKQEVGYKGDIIWDCTKPNGQSRRFLATNLAKEKFGFQSRVGLHEGIKNTVRWYNEQCGK